ncbi:MAG TPA: hypothetical protein VLL94_11995 [Nitrospiraceae bacterium]|nr:hypothetical protein [Nitrospiraceae bacterium]
MNSETQKIMDQVAEEFHCDHLAIELRYKAASDGMRTYWMSCLRCGEKLSRKKRADLTPREISTTLPYDPIIHREYWKRRNARYDELSQSIKAKQNDEWWAWYSDYLKTPQWREKRQLVMKRAGGLCEGCAHAPATQVHHLTYERAGREMLFDLVAICDACHEAVHGERQARKGGVRRMTTLDDLTRIEEVRLEMERITGLLKRRKADKWTLNRAGFVVRALEDLKAALAMEGEE